MRKKIVPLALLGVIMLSSCATIFQGSKQRVYVTAEPATAKIYIDDEYLGSGHADKKLRRNKEHIIMVKQEGYVTRHTTIDNHTQAGWIIADICTGWIGIIVDACTGAWNAFDRTHYNIELEKK